MPAKDLTAIDLIYQIIIDDNPATEPDTYIGFTPDRAGLVRELNEQGVDNKATMGEAPVALEVSMVEVGVRGIPGDYLTPRNEIMRLRYLIGRRSQNYTYDGLRLLWASPDAGIRHLGRDDSRRHQFSIIFECTTEPSE